MTNPLIDRERAEFLAARSSKGTQLAPAWPRADKELRLVQVEVNWVRFSTLNHRTKAEQLREMARADKPDLFTADPLGDAAQEAQYRILRGQEGFDTLKANLKERGQQQPAIITADGILINGNRRTAALRSLFRDDDFLPARYVTCQVLPQDATPVELVDLETELQVARDFKEDYGWINEALLIEELYDREGKDFRRVASRVHREVNDVRILHEKLQQVHQLVALSHGTRLLIDFNDNESAFEELAKHIKNKSPEEADSVRAVYFLGTLAKVNYRELRHLRRSDASELVVGEIASEPTLHQIITLANDSNTADLNDGDPLDEVLGEDAAPAPLNSLLKLIVERKPEEVIPLPGGETVAVQTVLNTLQSAINAAAYEAQEEERDQTVVTAPLVRADKAITELERAITALPKARRFEEWDGNAMTTKLSKLDGLLATLRAATQ